MANVIAETILSQLGGNKFIAMTGAKDFVAGAEYLRFKLPRVYNGISHVCITLEIDDTYRVDFTKWHARRLEHTCVANSVGVYADQLRAVFTNQTGLETQL